MRKKEFPKNEGPDFRFLFAAAVLSGFAGSVLTPSSGLVFSWEKLPGFYALFGAASAFLFVSAAPFVKKALPSSEPEPGT